MKKSLTIAAFAGMFAIVACGPSAEEKAAKEKATQDSIAAVEQAKVDSIAAEQAQAAEMAAPTDSTAAAGAGTPAEGAH